MSSVLESIKVINSAIRTAVALGFLAIIGGGGYWGYRQIVTERNKAVVAERELLGLQDQLGKSRAAVVAAEKEQELLKAQLAQREKQIERLLTSLQLLKVDQRLARLDVLSVEPGSEGKPAKTKVRFTELSPAGDALSGGREFEFDSDVIYIDNWIVQFDDKFVEAADIEKGTSLCLFRRIFAENQAPEDAYSLDEVGMRPQAYARGGVISDFEKGIWSKFWDFANDPEKAAEKGIRAANGQSVSIQLRPDMSYSVQLRASGGLSITPIK
jgi:hypothetical protein